jgi:hypothetical protein
MLALGVLFGCRPAPEANLANEAASEPVRNAAPPIVASAPGTPGGLPDDRTPLIEPNGPIDPKSAEAAGQVMQHYGALLEQHRFADAAALWGDAAAAAAFARQFGDSSESHLQVGKPGDSEGAAGSIYVTVPVVVYGRASGDAFSRPGSATLRRVNDVPGSTEAQRRWHIERIELGAAG